MNLLKVFILFLLCTFAYSSCIEDRATVPQTNTIGNYTPQCDEQVPEKYKALQCHGSIGFCWCADVDTGEKISDLFRAWEQENPCE